MDYRDRLFVHFVSPALSPIHKVPDAFLAPLGWFKRRPAARNASTAALDDFKETRAPVSVTNAAPAIIQSYTDRPSAFNVPAVATVRSSANRFARIALKAITARRSAPFHVKHAR